MYVIQICLSHLHRLSGISPFYSEADEDTSANIRHVRYDANALYHNVTKYAMKFIYQTLKRNPRYEDHDCIHSYIQVKSSQVKYRLLHGRVERMGRPQLTQLQLRPIT